MPCSLIRRGPPFLPCCSLNVERPSHLWNVDLGDRKPTHFAWCLCDIFRARGKAVWPSRSEAGLPAASCLPHRQFLRKQPRRGFRSQNRQAHTMCRNDQSGIVAMAATLCGSETHGGNAPSSTCTRGGCRCRHLFLELPSLFSRQVCLALPSLSTILAQAISVQVLL